MSTIYNSVDVLVVGAGLSGIGGACQPRRHSPDKSFAIFEARSASGGTWDLFRYPGIRSDSDMFTYAYGFKPWTDKSSIADGHKILSYIREAAQDYDIERHIHYRHKVISAVWSSVDKHWVVSALKTDTDETVVYRANSFLTAPAIMIMTKPIGLISPGPINLQAVSYMPSTGRKI